MSGMLTERATMDKHLPSISVCIQRHEMPQHTEEQFEEWAQWACGCRSDIKMDNPLVDCELLDYTSPLTFTIR